MNNEKKLELQQSYDLLLMSQTINRITPHRGTGVM